MKTADEWFNEGNALFQKGKFTEANECFDKVLEIDSKYMPAYRGKFRSLSAEGKNLEVIDWCKKALAVDPNYKFAYNSMGVAHQSRAEDQQALEAFNKAISIDPNFCFAYQNRGNTLKALQRFEEAIQDYDKAVELDPKYTDPLYGKANILQSLGRDQEALDLLEEVLKKSSKDSMALCNKAQLLSKLGRNKEALIDLKRVQEIQNSGYIDVEMGPGQRNFITSTLKMITELENIETQTEEVIKQQDQQNPVVQKLIDNMRKLKEKKEQVTTKLIAGMENKNNDDLVKQLSTLKEEFVQIKQELMDVKKDIKQIKSQLEDMREELNNKMDDFRKKLDAELGKADLSPEERTKLKDYFNAFIETFSSTHVTSQVIDSGQVQIDSDNSKATLLSVVASFTPFIGSVLSAGIKSIGDFLQSKEMKTNARKIKGLASDATRLSQIIGEAAYKIVIDKQKQKQILQVTNEDLKRISGNILQKISGFCKDLGEQIDVYLYTNLYQTASARLGHNDANHMIELWLDEKIDPYSVQEDIVRQAISMNSNEKEEAASPSLNAGSPGAQPKLENRSSCCNMF